LKLGLKAVSELPKDNPFRDALSGPTAMDAFREQASIRLS
jgi:hypothetical protein